MEALKTEITKALFNEEIIKKAFEQNTSLVSNFGFEINGITYNLRLSNLGNINLEFEVRDDYGVYNKIIGFYNFNSKGELESIHILKEFENVYEDIKGEVNFNFNNIVKYLTLEENGYISVCSREVINTVKSMFNSPKYSPNNHLSINTFQFENLVSNGLNVEVKTSMMGALEASLDESDEELYDVLVMFQKNGLDISIHCLEDVYSKLIEMKLLSIFN